MLRPMVILLPPAPADALWLPYLGHALDAGMAALFADEIIEGIKYTLDPLPYLTEAKQRGLGENDLKKVSTKVITCTA